MSPPWRAASRWRSSARATTVTVQPTGEDALANFADAAPDLVVLDVRLPGHRRLRGAPAAAARDASARSSSSPRAPTRSTRWSAWRWAPTTTSSSRSSVRELVSRIKALLRRAYGELADTQTGRTLRRERPRHRPGAAARHARRRAHRPDDDRIRPAAPPRRAAGARLHPCPAARAGPRLRRCPRAGRAHDQRPHQPHPRQGGAGSRPSRATSGR